MPPLSQTPYPGGPAPLWKVLLKMAALTAFGVLLAWLWVSCGAPTHQRPPRHPIPASTGGQR
jgi:hypothetical protein